MREQRVTIKSRSHPGKLAEIRPDQRVIWVSMMLGEKQRIRESHTNQIEFNFHPGFTDTQFKLWTLCEPLCETTQSFPFLSPARPAKASENLQLADLMKMAADQYSLHSRCAADPRVCVQMNVLVFSATESLWTCELPAVISTFRFSDTLEEMPH